MPLLRVSARCPKCGGNMFIDASLTGVEIECLQCSYRLGQRTALTKISPRGAQASYSGIHTPASRSANGSHNSGRAKTSFGTRIKKGG